MLPNRVSACVRLLDDVEGIRRRCQRACVRLLQELTPHLYAARAVDRELDRHLARRFNVFRYFRDDELGLSRIIADRPLRRPQGLQCRAGKPIYERHRGPGHRPTSRRTSRRRGRSPIPVREAA